MASNPQNAVEAEQLRTTCLVGQGWSDSSDDETASSTLTGWKPPLQEEMNGPGTSVTEEEAATNGSIPRTWSPLPEEVNLPGACAAEEAVAETVSRWRSATYSVVDTDNLVVQACFTPNQAAQLVAAAAPASLLRAVVMMVGYDEARSLSVCPSLTAMAIASVEDPACAKQLAASTRELWEIGGHCFAVISSLLASPLLTPSAKQNIVVALSQGAWGMCALRLAFLRSALQTSDMALKQSIACSIWQAITQDWQRGGPLWNALTSKEDGITLWGQIEWWSKPCTAEGYWTTGDSSTVSAESTARPITDVSNLESFPRTPSSLGSSSPRLDGDTPTYSVVGFPPWAMQVYVPC